MAVYYTEGRYNVRCNEVAFQTKPESGEESIAIRVTVLASVAADDSFVPETRQWEKTIYLKIDPNDEAKLEKILVSLRQAGWSGDNFLTLPDDLVGQEFVANCSHYVASKGEKAGEKCEAWYIWTPRAFTSEPLVNDPKVAKGLNALMGKKLKEIPARTTASKPKPSPKPDPEQSPAFVGKGDDQGPPDDDVPF